MSLPRAPHRAHLVHAVAVCAVAVTLAGCSGSGSGAAGRSPGVSASAAGDARRTVVTFTGASPLGAERLRRTADRMRARAEALGLKEVRVDTHGNEVTVTGRAADVKQLTLLGTSGHLGFRPVLAEETVGTTETPTPTPTPTSSAGADPAGRAVTDGLLPRAAGSASASAAPAPAEGSVPDAALQARYAALGCSARERNAMRREAPAGDAVVACGTTGGGSASRAKFILGPTAVEGVHVASAVAVRDKQVAGWVVRLGFDSVGARRFSDMTGSLAVNVAPRNQMAIVLDGAVISAPSVSQRLDGGTAEIYGSFTRESAEQLAVTVGSGALPAPLTVTSVTSLRHT
ncbi:SecDF P1 head subdomain-containing protein [Streptomyces sp. NPDC005070]